MADNHPPHRNRNPNSSASSPAHTRTLYGCSPSQRQSEAQGRVRIVSGVHAHESHPTAEASTSSALSSDTRCVCELRDHVKAGGMCPTGWSWFGKWAAEPPGGAIQ